MTIKTSSISTWYRYSCMVFILMYGSFFQFAIVTAWTDNTKNMNNPSLSILFAVHGLAFQHSPPSLPLLPVSTFNQRKTKQNTRRNTLSFIHGTFGCLDQSLPWTTTTMVPSQSNRYDSNMLKRRRNNHWQLYAANDSGEDQEDIYDNDDDDDDDDANLIDFDELDWRDFRAKLVTLDDGSTTTPTTPTTSSSSSTADTASSSLPSAAAWAYDSGTVIEEGSIILSNVEQDFGYGLNQQYFHKCVILVLYHDPYQFTKGVILNRPTDLMLFDDDFIYEDGSPLEPLVAVNEDEVDDNDNQKDNDTKKNSNGSSTRNQWNVWFGGDVQGFSTAMEPSQQDRDNEITPEIICLHSISTSIAKEVSTKIMKGIYWTTMEGARTLVQAKQATTHDFWIFCGYSGWGAGQLQDELQRGAWAMVATDSKTVLHELQNQRVSIITNTTTNTTNEHNIIREAGIHTWELLMSMIGRQQEAMISSGDFDDLMLREWAYENLHFGQEQQSPQGDDNDDDDDDDYTNDDELEEDPGTTNTLWGDIDTDSIAQSLSKVMASATDPSSSSPPLFSSMGQFQGGTLLRASSADRSPFLLADQGFHKSIILILQDEIDVTMGVVLNHPYAQSVEFVVQDDDYYGDDSNEEETFEIPQRYGGKFGVKGEEEKPTFWFHCSDTLRNAQIGEPLPKDYDNDGIWKVDESEVLNAIRSGIAGGNDFMAVSGLTIWSKQQGSTFLQEVAVGNFEIVSRSKTKAVWDILMSQEVLSTLTIDKNLMLAKSAWEEAGETSTADNSDEETKVPKSTTNDNQTSHVFNSNVKVSDLCDDALRCWVAAYLLGEPILRLSNSAFG